MTDKRLKRVFFALWPDDLTRDAISYVFNQSIYTASSGQASCSTNLHLTLHFLGNLAPVQLDCALQQAAKIDAVQFELFLDTFACFEKPKILWLGPSAVSYHLMDLHAKLASALGVCDVPIESRTYQPHVTLMRKFKGFKVSEVPQEVLWKVKQFALVESVSTKNGVEYRPLMFYPLKP